LFAKIADLLRANSPDEGCCYGEWKDCGFGRRCCDVCDLGRCGGYAVDGLSANRNRRRRLVPPRRYRHEQSAGRQPLQWLGIGYQFNPWLRADITGEYRGKANFHGLDIVDGGDYTDEYRASKSEWLALVNIYADLGTWYSITPFVGLGIGAANVTISNFLDVNTPLLGVAYGGTASKWNFAWAVHAGLAYRVNSRLSFEFAYRFVSLGDGITGDLVVFDGTNLIYNPMEFKNITSHDLKFGLRWFLDAPMYAPPLMRKG
jgi:opacity protein-like surface antigen